MSDNQPDKPASKVDEDLQKALAAFGEDALELLEDDDDDFSFAEMEEDSGPCETPQDDPIQHLVERFGEQINEDSTLSYAGTIALQCSRAASSPARPGSRFIVFACGDLQFGVPMENVAEIARCGKITTLPRTAEWLQGVTNLRGQICSVTDFGILLQLPAGKPVTSRKIIVLRSHAQSACTAIVVDRVSGIRSLEPSSDGLPDLNHRIATLAIGTATSDGTDTILIDPDRLLGCQELTTYSIHANHAETD